MIRHFSYQFERLISVLLDERQPRMDLVMREDFDAHKALLSIGTGKPLSQGTMHYSPDHYFRSMQDDAQKVLVDAGIAPGEIKVERHLDMRYRGQGYEIEVPLPAAADPGELFDRIPQLFAQAYEQIFSLSYLEEPVEILHWKVDVSGPSPRFDNRWSLRQRKASGDARKGSRRAYFPERDGYVDCPVYDRYALAPGVVIEGPALVEERESTCVLGVGDRASIDEFGNMIAEIGGQT